jgi:hypothetical protein
MNIIKEHAYFEMFDWEECWRLNLISLDVVYSIHQINISIKIQLSNQFGLPHFTIPFLFPSTIYWIFNLEFVPRNNPPYGWHQQ